MRPRALLVLLAALAAGACGAEPRARRASHEPLLADGVAATAYTSPARWRYHPRAAAPLLSRLSLSDGSVLFAGERGERWLSRGQTAETAPQLAPEPLVSILRSKNAWWFVGASGTGYEALEPLGPFTRASAPIEPLARISAAGRTIAGIRRDGRLVRTADAGATWQEVGPEGARFVDVALAGKTGLALAVPERLWVTNDEAVTWKPLDAPSIGALGLAIDKDAGMAVRAVLGAHRVSLSPKPSLDQLGRKIEPEQHQLRAVPPRGPDGEAIAEGRAFFAEGRYFEVAEREKGRGYVLWSGPSDGTLEARPLARAAGCREVRLAGFGDDMVLACARRSSTRIGQKLELYVSKDAGRSFHADAYVFEGRLAELGLAVGARRTVLVTGACSPHADSSGCSPAGVHRLDLGKAPPRGEEKASKALVLSATPALDGSALALAFSIDGERAYLVGRRTKRGELSLFVSHDGAKSFEARDLDRLGFAERSSDETSRSSERDSSFDVESLSTAEDGGVALVVKGTESRLLVVTDEDGRVVAVSRPPDESALIGATGSRALAIAPRTQSVWESTDGGASWDALGRLPLDPCPERSRCAVALRCHPGGCVLGQELSRLGWRGQADEDQALLPPPEQRVLDVSDRKLRASISCTLDETAWRALPGVSRAPTASDAALGKVTWFTVGQDDTRAAVWTTSVVAGERGAIETTSLLAPAPRPETQAYRVSYQAEGAAAVRYVIPEARPGETRLLNLEVAWQNFLEGRVGRGRLTDAGVYRPGDYKRAGGVAQQAQTDLLSIASGGLYLRVHHSEKDAQETLFFDGRNVQRVPAVDWPAVDAAQQIKEMVHVDGAHVPLLLVGAGAAVMRARARGGRWELDAFTTGLMEPAGFAFEQIQRVTYVGTRAALNIQLFDTRSGAGQSFLLPFRAQGAVLDPPLPVPTQQDVGDRPARCNAEQLQKTPRVVAPFQPGTRHPIVVADAVEPLRVMLTSGAVLHGTPDSACVAAFDAHTVLDDPHVLNEQAHAVLPMAELERSWLFRQAPDSDAADPRIEARPMKCRFEPSLEVPPDVYQAPGTSVRRSR